MKHTFPDLSQFNMHKTKHGVVIDGLDLPFVTGHFYRRIDDNSRIETIGVYSIDSKNIFAAWGYADEDHCSYHALCFEDIWSEVQIGCPQLALSEQDKVQICLKDKWHTFSAT